MIDYIKRGLTLVLLSVVASAAQGEENSQPADSEWLNETVQACAACHGETGVAQTPNFPIIAGQYRDYLVHTLKQYRDGARGNAIMAGQVQGMSNAQLKALARYYSVQDSPLHTPGVD